MEKLSWKSMGKGIDISSMWLERPDSSSTSIRLVRFQSGNFTFSVTGSEGKGFPVDYLVSKSGFVAGINANYYYYKDKSGTKSPLGLVISDKKTVSPWRDNYSGCFFYDGIKAGILYKEKPPAGTVAACQSFPVVIYDGFIPDGVRESGGLKLDIQRKSRRSAVAQDRRGNIYFFISVQDMSFQEVGVVCGAIGLHRSLCLDGGSSTQFCIMDSDTLIMSGIERVPYIIGVKRK
jgi:uncharacterized protein YigE (DUF2233 family)